MRTEAEIKTELKAMGTGVYPATQYNSGYTSALKWVLELSEELKAQRPRLLAAQEKP